MFWSPSKLLLISGEWDRQESCSCLDKFNCRMKTETYGFPSPGDRVLSLSIEWFLSKDLWMSLKVVGHSADCHFNDVVEKRFRVRKILFLAKLFLSCFVFVCEWGRNLDGQQNFELVHPSVDSVHVLDIDIHGLLNSAHWRADTTVGLLLHLEAVGFLSHNS